ncbi:hypothetical protein Pcinc_037212 [Petrolisthes cinctipes]|uniref:Uncharacterized protein n=1 Tax=Petrolisthes cinctipes TaxID=88211 RepID=A0AAE1BW50_PETCI|nr:hypothetical protein Pcinc_037212 [Petrolisthes cinctipes]
MKTHRLTHNEGRNEVPEGYHRCTECLQMFASERGSGDTRRRDIVRSHIVVNIADFGVQLRQGFITIYKKDCVRKRTPQVAAVVVVTLVAPVTTPASSSNRPRLPRSVGVGPGHGVSVAVVTNIIKKK